MMDVKQLLLDFSTQTGISGREHTAAAYAAKALSAFGEVETTPLGSVLCRARSLGDGAPLLLLDAHLDEIGLIVTRIDEAGFLRVGACGGVDRRVLAAAPVAVHTAGGPVTGVVCSVPPHLAGSEEAAHPKVEELCVDIGMNEADAKRAVSLGDPATLCCDPIALAGGMVCGKALDDRAGCVALLAALDFLKNVPLGCSLAVQFSSMEEIGGQGAKTAAYRVNPTHAIAVDVSFAYTPDSAREKCADLGGGPMIGVAPILNKALSDKMIAVAAQCGIPFQQEVMGGKTGTNADAIAVTRAGVATGLVSIPLRYMHTPVEVVSVSDVENTGLLIAQTIKSFFGGMS